MDNQVKSNSESNGAVQVQVSKEAARMIESYRDGEQLLCAKACLLDALLRALNSSKNESESMETLSVISDLNDLINELSKTPFK